MREDLVILIAEDDAGHFWLVKKNLAKAGLENEIVQFRDGQEILDFLFMRGDDPNRVAGKSYLLLLDIQIDKVDGIEVLRRIKEDEELRALPVIMMTMIDEPVQMDLCYSLGCNIYIVKPTDYDEFTASIQAVGSFISVAHMPVMG